MQNTYKRSLFDRYDGRRVRNVDPVFGIVPFILRTRIDSQNFFEENIPVDKVEDFVRAYKKHMPELSFMHVIIAAMVRLYSQRPYLNRFVVWNKLYAHNTLTMSMIIKRSMDDKGEETLIKPVFELTDTLEDVVRRMHDTVLQSMNTKGDVDKAVRIFKMLPSFIVRASAFLMHNMDKIGILPKALFKVSPWHCSMFFTNLGSLGIGPIYHHLYEFGTCSVFLAMGNKTRVHSIGTGGEREVRRFIGLKFVTDERICDGHYYASSMKLLRRILLRPDQLLEPPNSVVEDDGVPRRDKS